MSTRTSDTTSTTWRHLARDRVAHPPQMAASTAKRIVFLVGPLVMDFLPWVIRLGLRLRGVTLEERGWPLGLLPPGSANSRASFIASLSYIRLNS
jgi:hypothetical protein